MENKKNYDAEMQRIIKGFEGEKPRLLLHSCCGPCSTSVIERLVDDFRLTVFFYNPNIDDEDEYEKRKANQLKYINERYGDKVDFIEGKYDVSSFMAFAADMAEDKEGGGRCFKCFELRLRESAELASKLDFDYFTTTLTVSPMKNSAIINPLGEKIASEFNVEYLPSDFKKRGGYQKSIELSKEYELYRQHFCGCSFSKWD